MPPSTIRTSSAECPNCGHHGIVEYEPKVYGCLKCDFEKDFTAASAPEEKSPVGGVMAGLGLLLAVLFWL